MDPKPTTESLDLSTAKDTAKKGRSTREGSKTPPKKTLAGNSTSGAGAVSLGKSREKSLGESNHKMQYEKEVINSRVDEIWREVDRLNNALKALEHEKVLNERKAKEELEECMRQRDQFMERVQIAEQEAEIKTGEACRLEAELRRVAKMNEHLQKQNTEQRNKLCQFEQIEVIIDKPDGKSLRDLISETVDINNRYDSKLKTTTENFSSLLKKYEKAVARIEILERDNQVLTFKAEKAVEYKKTHKPIDTATRDNKIKVLEASLAEANKNIEKLVKEVTRWKIESSNSKVALAKELSMKSSGKENRLASMRQSDQYCGDQYSLHSNYQSSHSRQLFQRLGYIPKEAKHSASLSTSNSFLEPITPARIDSGEGYSKPLLRKVVDLEVEPTYRELAIMHDNLVDRCQVLHDLVHNQPASY